MPTHIDALIRAVLEKVQTYLRDEFKVDLRTQTVGRLPPSAMAGVGGAPFVYLRDADGAWVIDSDNAYLTERT